MIEIDTFFSFLDCAENWLSQFTYSSRWMISTDLKEVLIKNCQMKMKINGTRKKQQLYEIGWSFRNQPLFRSAYYPVMKIVEHLIYAALCCWFRIFLFYQYSVLQLPFFCKICAIYFKMWSICHKENRTGLKLAYYGVVVVYSSHWLISLFVP